MNYTLVHVLSVSVGVMLLNAKLCLSALGPATGIKAKVRKGKWTCS